MTEPAGPPLPAGNFSSWLRAMRAALAGTSGMDVACGDCRGCCTSAYFIKVRAHEVDALRHIPAEQLVDSPREPGTRLMGFDAAGHCPMFVGGNCSIYPHRPQTCRTYDCRVFTAAGMTAGEHRHTINQRIARWRFEYADDTGRAEHRAVTAAANFLRQHPVRFPSGNIPSLPGDIAVLALKAYAVFLGDMSDDRATAAAIVAACRAFDQDAA
jgi:Fe-S-cluster containining protein